MLTATVHFLYLAATPLFMAIHGAAPGFVTAAAISVGMFITYCLSTWQRMNEARLSESGARIEADRGAGPVSGELAFDLVVQRARTIAHAEHQRTAGFAADDVGVGFALFLEDVFDQSGQPLRAFAEHALGGADQIVLLIGRRIFGDHGGGRHIAGGGGAAGRRFARLLVPGRKVAVVIDDLVGGIARYGWGRCGVVEIGIDRGVRIEFAHLGRSGNRR